MKHCCPHHTVVMTKTHHTCWDDKGVFFIEKFSMKKRTAKLKEHWYRRHLQQQFFLVFVEKWKIQRRHVGCLQTQRLGTTAKAQRSPPTQEFKEIVQQLLNKTFQHREQQSGMRFSERQIKCSLRAEPHTQTSTALHIKTHQKPPPLWHFLFKNKVIYNALWTSVQYKILYIVIPTKIAIVQKRCLTDVVINIISVWTLQ